MLIYITMIICTVLLALCMPYSYKKGNLYLYSNKLLIFLPPFFILAFRYGIGVDYFGTYVSIFKHLINKSYEGVEFGYILLNKIILIFTDNFFWLFIITSLIFCFFMFKSIFEQSKYRAISIYIFLTAGLYFYSMNVMRQTIGFAIFLYALKYIKNKDLKKYLFYILIATSIHKSSLIYLPIYFIDNIKIDYKRFIFISFVVILSKNIIFNLIEVILYGTKYHNYITGIYGVSSNSMVSPIINFIIIFIFLLFYKEKNNDVEYRIYLNIHIVTFLISLLLDTIPLISRVFLGFYHVIILSIPYLISLLKGKKSKELVTLFVFLFFGIIFIYSIGIKNGNGVLPYKTIFSVM